MAKDTKFKAKAKKAIAKVKKAANPIKFKGGASSAMTAGKIAAGNFHLAIGDEAWGKNTKRTGSLGTLDRLRNKIVDARNLKATKKKAKRKGKPK